jgi:hypothetical protein
VRVALVRALLAPDLDDQVVTAVAVDVTDREIRAELVVGLGLVLDARRVLVPQTILGAGQPVHRTTKHVDRARARLAVDLFEHADCEVVEAVAVECSRNESASELLVEFAAIGDPTDVLVQQTVKRETLGAAAVDDEHSRTQNRLDGRLGRGDGEIVETIGIEIATRERHSVIESRGISDFVDQWLGEQLRVPARQPAGVGEHDADGAVFRSTCGRHADRHREVVATISVEVTARRADGCHDRGDE